MTEEHIHSEAEEGGRMQIGRQYQAAPRPAPATARRIEPPPPMDDHQATLEARVRLKLAAGEPLDGEEGQFLAHLYGDRDVHY